MLKLTKMLAVASPIALAVGLGVALAVPAQAAIYTAPYYYTKMVNKSSAGNYINKAQRLALCNVATNGTTCSISSGKTATRTIDLAFNATRAGIAGTLGISSSASQTISVSCTSPRMNKGQNFVAYPVGIRYTYKLQKYYWTGYASQYQGISGGLAAFNPYSNAISCGLA